MRVISHDFYNIKRVDRFTIVPIGDIHIGAAACDERLLKDVVARVAGDDTAYWIGMGDYCDFINRSDPRFNPGALADWVKMADLADLAAAQRDRFLEIIKPIAPKCLCLLEGNHETAITRHYERHVYFEICAAIKQFAGLEEDDKLALGYNGWLKLNFYRSKKRKEGSGIVKINLHHGFVGGRLDGAKALNMQRRMAFCDADLCLMGHSHNTMVQSGAREYLAGMTVKNKKTIGAYTGTFLKSYNPDGPATYSEVKGYLPMPLSRVEILLRPGAKEQEDRIKVLIL